MNNEKYKNKYRTKSNRLQNWDYGWNASYFVTICTKGREHFFGEIKKGNMEFSKIGDIVHKFWLEIPKHFPFVNLGEFVVMPNHIHGIIIIDKNDNNAHPVETPKLDVSTMTTTPKTNGGKNPKWKPNILGSIINQYKRICTINARKTNRNFAWQSRYYDHIIRDKKSFNKISEYIINNPINWGKDRL